MIQVIDNYLTENQCNEIERLLLKDFSLPWFLGRGLTYPDINKNPFRVERKMLFHHFVFDNNVSNFFGYISNCFYFDDIKELINVRANLIMPGMFDIRHSRYHTDYVNKKFKTAIYYVNGFNTPTIFKTGHFTRKLVFPKRNRIVIFDGHIEHAHYMPFWKERSVINFNFYI